MLILVACHNHAVHMEGFNCIFKTFWLHIVCYCAWYQLQCIHREYFLTSTCIAFLISFESFELSHLSPNTIEHASSQQHSSPSCLVWAFLSNITVPRHNSPSPAVQGNKLGEAPLAQEGTLMCPVTSALASEWQYYNNVQYTEFRQKRHTQFQVLSLRAIACGRSLLMTLDIQVQ